MNSKTLIGIYLIKRTKRIGLVWDGEMWVVKRERSEIAEGLSQADRGEFTSHKGGNGKI